MRTFIAIELPDAFAREVEALSRSLERAVNGRFVPGENHHITLAFLGDIIDAETTRAIDALEAACENTPPLALKPDGLGKFGRSNDATLFLSLAATPDLTALAQRLRNELAARDLPFDSKAFRPHITLSRHTQLTRGTLPNLPFPFGDTAQHITLFKSTLHPEGAQYKPLYTVKLPVEQGISPSQ